MAKKTEEVEVLAPAVVEEISTTISSALVKENITDMVIEELYNRYDGLSIIGVADKKGYLDVQEGRKDAKKVRVLIGKVCKKGREHANAEAQMWISKEKQLIARVSPLEDKLEKMESWYESENERIETERRQAMETRYASRIQELTGFGGTLQEGFWKLEDVSFEIALVKEGDDDIYFEIRDAFKARFDVKDGERIRREEKERREREELEKLRRQRRAMRVEVLRGMGMSLRGPDFVFMEGFGMHFNDTHMAMILDGDSDYWDETIENIDGKIAQFNEDKVAEESKKKAEEDSKEKMRKRIGQLNDFGLKFNFNANQYEGYACAVHYFDITGYDDEKWDGMIAKMGPHIEEYKKQEADKAEQKKQKDLKDAEDKARGIDRLRMLSKMDAVWQGETIDLGRLSIDEWGSEYNKAKDTYDKEQLRLNNIQKEKELAESSDKEKFEHVVKYLLATPIPEMKSTRYRGKLRIIADFIDQFKQ